MSERTAVEHEQRSTGKNYRTHTHIFLILTNKRERRTPPHGHKNRQSKKHVTVFYDDDVFIILYHDHE